MAESVAYANVGTKRHRIIPPYDRVVVKPCRLESETIVIPKHIQDRQQSTEGIIVAVGDPLDAPFQFSVGDKVCFSRYAGVELVLTEDDKEASYRILTFEQVLCKLEEDNAG